MLGLILQSIRNVQPWNVYSEEVIVVIYREINDLNTVLALVVVAITFQLFQSYAKQPKCISIYVQVSKMGMEVFPRTGLFTVPTGDFSLFYKWLSCGFCSSAWAQEPCSLRSGVETAHRIIQAGKYPQDHHSLGMPTHVLLLFRREERNQFPPHLFKRTLVHLASTVNGYFS